MLQGWAWTLEADGSIINPAPLPLPALIVSTSPIGKRANQGSRVEMYLQYFLCRFDFWPLVHFIENTFIRNNFGSAFWAEIGGWLEYNGNTVIKLPSILPSRNLWWLCLGLSASWVKTFLWSLEMISKYKSGPFHISEVKSLWKSTTCRTVFVGKPRRLSTQVFIVFTWNVYKSNFVEPRS